MAKITQVVVELPEQEYLNPTNDRSVVVSSTVKKNSLQTAGRIVAIVGLIIFALFSVIPSKYKFIVNDILRLKKNNVFFSFYSS